MSPSTDEVKKAIESYLRVALPESPKNLFAQGFLDSLQSVGLILHLEKTFAVKLSVLDLAEDDAFTLGRLTALLAKAKRAQSSAP